MTGLDRPDLFIVVRIFEALRANSNRLRKTQLQMRSGINYTIFLRYLQYLLDRQLVCVVSDSPSGEWVELTSQGNEAYRFLLDGFARYFRGEISRQPT